MAIKLIEACKKLNIGMTTVVEFCTKQGWKISTDPSSRIDDDLYHLLEQEFNKDVIMEPEKMAMEDFISDNQISKSLADTETEKDMLLDQSKSVMLINENTHMLDFDDENCEICLNFYDKAIEAWNNNQNTPFNFERLKQLLTNNSIDFTCYFQKLASNDHDPRCTMFVVLSPDYCIEVRMKLNVNNQGLEQYCYFFVPRMRVVALPPHKDCVKIMCSFKIIENNAMGDKPTPTILRLMREVEKLSIPKVDINQERDKKIWNKYVEALRKLVFQKEQIWKVKAMSDRPFYSKELANEDDQLIEIYIEEKKLRKQFEKEIADTFRKEDLVEYVVNDKTCFLEFSGNRDMSKGEYEEMLEMAERYFYEIKPNSPTRSLFCQLQFKYSLENIRESIFPEIEKILKDEYQLDVSIEADNYVNVAEKHIRHVEKVIANKYASFLTLDRHNAICHDVRVNCKSRHFNPDDFCDVLHAKNIKARPKLYFKHQRFLHIEIGASLTKDCFSQFGFEFVKKTYTFYSPSTEATLPVDGLYIEDGHYCIDTTEDGINYKKYIKLIRDTLGNDSFDRGRTKYVFEFVDEAGREILRNFKTDVEQTGKISFNLQTSQLRIVAENENEHQTILANIRQNCPNVVIKEAPYLPKYYIQIKGEAITFRKEIIETIQNALRAKNYDKIKYDSYRNYECTAITYLFENDDERKQFVNDLEAICASYADTLEIQFENKLGITRYEFVKNNRLIQTKEREIRNNVLQASFVYLSEEEYNKLKQLCSEKGDEYSTRDGIQIGVLLQKEGDCFTFKISRDFLELLEKKGANTLTGGFIRPIFPGELTNINRMVRAMRKITSPNRGEYPANRNISNFIFDPSTIREPFCNLDDVKRKILKNLKEPLLKTQPKQLEAVAKAIAAPDIAIIQGPPGTGKTTVIAEIIWQTLLDNPNARILITSQTNLAVDNVLERLKGKRMVRPIRIGNIEKFENEGKVYSDYRLKNWVTAPVGSKEEHYHQDNAIHAWLNSIRNSICVDEELAAPLKIWHDNLQKNTEKIKEIFSKQYNQHINVFAATCSECGSRHFSELFNMMFNAGADSSQEPVFDLVIMDEASKATPPELVLPLTLGKKMVVIGDHKQLPPMIDSEEFEEVLCSIGAKQLAEELSTEELKVSQFEKLFSHAPNFAITSLDTQFRMHGQIMKCISQFYADQKELEHGLICGINETQDIPNLYDKASRWHGLSIMPFLEPDVHAIWVNVATPEQQHKNSTSYYNMGEVEAIQIVLRALIKADGFQEYMQAQVKEEDKEIGVITYYMSQMRAIRKALYPSLNKNKWSNFEQYKLENEYVVPFRINTVDRFQGMERNIVIVSTVRSNKFKSENGFVVKNEKYPTALGFAKELQRINVGFSRAKRLLIVIGNKEHFSHKPEYARAIAQMKCIDIRQLQNL